MAKTRDLFEENGIKFNAPTAKNGAARDLFAENGIEFNPTQKSQQPSKNLFAMKPMAQKSLGKH